ncbi:MAG: dihydropteroate synthase [Bacteroidales bacterium]
MGFKDTFFSGKTSFNCHGRLVEVRFPLIMGIVNLTPDSFYSRSRFETVPQTLEKIAAMVSDGADIIDLGAVSTRPGSLPPDEEEEKKRLFPVLEAVRKKFPDLLMSVDTWRSGIARQAVENFGADIINDVSAGNLDPEMISTAAACKVPYILMHMQGTPASMQQKPEYRDIMQEMLDFFHIRTAACLKAGITDLILDPGFGFGKTLEQNYILLNRLSDFSFFGFPLMVGLSRKSMIYKVLETDPESALNGSSVLHTIALLQGAEILRVHDVREAKETIRLVKFLLQNSDQEH